MSNKRIDQLPNNGNQIKGTDLFPIFSDGKTEKNTIDELKEYIGSNTSTSITSYNIVTPISANTLTQITHNLNSSNLLVQTWNSNEDLVDMYVSKYSGDTNNILSLESTVSDTYRINVLSISGISTTNTNYNSVTGLLVNTPLIMEHNLNNQNILIQSWLESSGEIVDISITKYSGDTSNKIVLESTISDIFRINILGL